MATPNEAPKQASDREVDRYRAERTRIEEAVEDGTLAEADGNAILEFLQALDPDVMTVDPGEVGTKEYSTMYTYAQALRLTAFQADTPLVDISTDELNEVMDRWDISNNTKLQRQSALRVFYRWCDGCAVDPEGVIMADRDESSVDDRYIFDREEIDAMREQIDNSRDRAVFDMMLYTGQRIKAILSLKVRDINLEEGTFYLNGDDGGLKGASGKRPLLQAQDAVASWMDDHPTRTEDGKPDPDAYFITARPSAAKKDPYSMLYRSTIQRVIKEIGREAGIPNADERVHPHNFRHTFVTWAKRKHGMDDSTIKAILGQAPDSRIMEATYQHLSDDDVIRSAKEATGELEPEDDPLVPETCRACGRTLRHDDQICPRCMTPVTHEAANAQAQVHQDIGEERAKADADQSSELTDKDLEAIAEDDALLARLIELRSEGD